MDKKDGASASGHGFMKRDPEKVKQRKLKRGKRREERRKYGHNKKRRAEYKADAAAKRKAIAQAAIVGGDHQAGGTDAVQSSSIKGGQFQFDGGSMGDPKKKAARQEKRAARKEARADMKTKKAKLKAAGQAGKAAVKAGVTSAKAAVSKAKAAAMREAAMNKKRPTQVEPDTTPTQDQPMGDGASMHNKGYGYRGRRYDNVPNMSVPARKLDYIQKSSGPSMNAHQDKEASMDDYSHEKKLGADGRYDLEHGHKSWAKNDFDHAHALKKDAHHDARSRISILKHMKKF